MRVRVIHVAYALAAASAGALALAAVVLYSGFYNIAATHQHLAPTYVLLDIGLRESVERRARDIAVPPLGEPAVARRGLALYRTHCSQCHGAPGAAPEPFALGLTPLPANLAHAARIRSAAELYWVIRNGIKMTGMPAWEFRLGDADLWAVTAFVRELPRMSPEEYRARLLEVERDPPPREQAQFQRAPDAQRGRVALRQYGCITCHAIPGLVGEHGPVGPPLERIGTRKDIAGVLPNTPENMVRWIRAPQAVNPRSAMPDLRVTEQHARDMAAYLYTLR